MAPAYPAFQGLQSAAGAADGYRAARAPARARSAGEAFPARAVAARAEVKARDTDDASSSRPNASQGLL